MKIGSAKYGGDYKKKTFAKLKDGEQAFRILPPLGDLADKGIWSVFWNVHYGYTNSAGKLRTFASPLVKNHKTKMIEVPDAALERIQKLKGQLEAAKAAGDKDTYDKIYPLVMYNPATKKGAKFNMASAHYVNAVDTNGNIVVLELKHTAKQALDIEIRALRDKGVDPLSVDNGRYFVFRRAGMGLSTSFKVSVMQETINVPNVGEVKRDLVHKLDAGLIARLSTDAANLDRLYKCPSSEEVARIVRDGASAVDAILDTKASVHVDEADDEVSQEVVSETAAPAVTTQVAAAPVQSTVTSTPVAVPAAVTPTVTVAPVAAMSDDEFLKSMGL